MHNRKSVLEKNSLDFLYFGDTSKSSNFGPKTRARDSQQKKRTYRIVGVAVHVNHKVKLKEIKIRKKYHDLAREMKKLWNMK